MAGVGKLLKQAQKMQKQMEAIQAELAETMLDVSSGGGAVQVKINGQGEFQSFKLDPEFLKEDPEFVEETLLAAVQEAAAKAKETSEEAMGSVTGGAGGFPGLM
jgi:DNA-binding YbaB/EbfC family protein